MTSPEHIDAFDFQIERSSEVCSANAFWAMSSLGSSSTMLS